MTMVLIILCILFLLAAIFLFFAATVGLLRLPDFYTRMHATGKGDTLGVLCAVVSMIMYSLYQDCSWMGIVLSVKIASIAVFWFVASPTATHALLRSAFQAGVAPWTRDGKTIIDQRDGGRVVEYTPKSEVPE